ncbi:hypothetical protein Tco_0827293 [Tanacetum coccineum]
MISNGIPSVDCESQKLMSTDVVDVLQAYSALCSSGIGGRRSVNVRRTTTVSSYNFIHDNGNLRNTGPSTSHGGRNARGNPDVSLTTGGATCSRGISSRRSNFIHDNVQATCSSGVTRRHSVRRSPSTRGPTFGSSSASGALFVKCVVTCFFAGTSYTYTDFGDSDQSCRHCGASFWMRHFGGIHNSDLDPQMVEGLIYFLDAYNELVQLFKTARDKCRELDIPEFKIRLYNGEGVRGYEFPTSNTLGEMVFESGITSNTNFDIIIQHKDGPPQRLNKFHPSYMSLARRITMLAYYRYQLHFCLQQYGLLFRDGRLFQQYVVGVFCAVKQNRLDFLRKKQNDIRADYLSGLYDAISRGEHDAELPDPRIDPNGYNIVSEMMMHCPYRAANMKASCMKGDKCGKSFPKKFNSKTFLDNNGHVHYQIRDTGITTTRNQFKLDNNYVVPYNRDLLLAFQAHINVEYCGWSMLIKYLFKYISKGTDRIFAQVSRPMGESSTEFDIHHREPAIQILAEHLEDMQLITFRDRDSNETGRHLSYLEFPSGRHLSPRRNSKSLIGRLAYVHPTSGELFLLRMLLCHQKGCRDFFEVQTINDVFYPTDKLGLLGDDREWETTLEEACAYATSEQLRFIFSHLLHICDVADPSKLWTKYREQMSQDIPKKVSNKVQIPNYHLNANSLQGYTLYELIIILNNFCKFL